MTAGTVDDVLQCRYCEVEKPVSAFPQFRGRPNGRRCQECDSKQRTERYRSDPEYAERQRQRAREHFRANRERTLQRNREWRAAHRDGEAERARRNTLRAKYGLTVEAYNALLEQQGGKCAVCGGLDSQGRALAVDHDHRTGMVRGLLCDFCNRAIGLVRDDAATAEVLAAYLKSHET